MKPFGCFPVRFIIVSETPTNSPDPPALGFANLVLNSAALLFLTFFTAIACGIPIAFVSLLVRDFSLSVLGFIAIATLAASILAAASLLVAKFISERRSWGILLGGVLLILLGGAVAVASVLGGLKTYPGSFSTGACSILAGCLVSTLALRRYRPAP
jgi:hypothetical protein